MLEFPPDITALYQALLFVVLWVVLKRLVFDRFVEALQARHRKTSGALAEASKLREEAGRLRGEYDSLMNQIRSQALQAKEAIRRQAEEEERQLIARAREESKIQLEELRRRLAQEVSAARAALEGEVEELAERVARSVLERSS